jgi:hypothetical protein
LGTILVTKMASQQPSLRSRNIPAAASSSSAARRSRTHRLPAILLTYTSSGCTSASSVAGKRPFDAAGTWLCLQLADTRVIGYGVLIATYDRQ